MAIIGSGTCSKNSNKTTSATLPISFTTFARWTDSINIGGSNWTHVNRTITGLSGLSSAYFEVTCDSNGSYTCSGASARILVIGI